MKASGVVIVVRDDGTILTVTNRGHGGFGLPGGKCELGEDPKSAAVRELAEETSLVAREVDLTLCAVGRSSAESDRMVHVYHVACVHGVATAVEDGTTVLWQTMRDLVKGSPFALFYVLHFPDGVRHMVPTVHIP